MEEKMMCIFVTLSILLFCSNLAFTIGGSIVLDKTNVASDSDNEFFNVWLSNIILTIISGIVSLVSLFTCCGLTSIDSDNKSNKDKTIELVNLGVSIWTMIIYFGGQTDLSGLESEYYPLFMLLKIRVFYSVTMLSLIGLIIALYCLFACCGGIYFCLNKEEEEVEEVYKEAKIKATYNTTVYDDETRV